MKILKNFARTAYAIILLYIVSALTSLASDDWQRDVEAMLAEFMSCGGPTPPNTPCNIFTSKALKRIYGITDFDRQDGSFLTANEIASYVEFNTTKWTLLGAGNVQQTLTDAQEYANRKKAIIAVQYNATGHGHVAIILPGSLQPSGSWQLKCPNSASFFLNRPRQAYVSKPLSFAFTNPTEVRIYGRNY